MEDMDIDLVLEIPDTPDRLPTRRMNIGNCVQEESSSSVAGRLGGSASVSEESLYRLTGKDRLLIGNRHNREHNIHPRRGFVNAEDMECPKNTIVLSSPENAQGSTPLFRKATMEKSRNSFRGQHMDKGKAHSTMLPFKSSRSQEDNANLDLMEQNVQKQVLEMAPPQDGLKNCLPEGRREGQLPRNGGSYLRNCSNTSATSGDHSKGKEKIDEYGSKNIGPVMVHGKGTSLSNGSSLRAEKPFPTSQHSLVPPKATVKKRLVRHGCISPQNIAIRTKQSNEQSQNSSKAEQNSGNMVSSSPSMTDIREIIAGDNVYSKGKQVVHPQTSKDHDMNLIDLCSSPMSINGKATGSSDSARDARIEENGGWRSTHNHSKSGDRAAVRHFYRFDDVGRRAQNENRVVKRDNFNRENSSIGCDHSDNQGPTEPSRATMLPKRQKKRVFGSRSCGESSRFIPNDSDLVILGSSRESSGSRSSSVHIGEHMDVLDLDGSSAMRGANASGIDPVNNEESEARARQVEADEMLARELQEQLYDEVPMFGNGEIDENIAWALQQEEDSLLPTSTRSHREPEHRGSTRHSRAQPPLRIGQSSSSRRGVQTRLPTSARMSRLRSRVFNQPRAGPSRSRNFRFPLGMDLDMRLEILEAMEAAIGDADDMGMANNIFRVQRDFTENDYEMLLALDENNHQHGGASTNQINSLPQSKVQTDNFEEACAICLETPTVGETIRHLPCLHKFHKDCIDPWLSRKTSCPICKSSIT